jgi:hypothetical protein
VGTEGGRGSPKAPLIHMSVSTPSMRQLTRCGEDQTRSLHAWNMENKHSREILPTSFIICPIPNLWPAGTQAQDNDQRWSSTDSRIWTRALSLIIFRLQSHPSLLRSVLRFAYLEALHSLALLASVSQGQVSSTKAILCLPCTDRSRMTRFGLCAGTMTSAGINPPPGSYIPSKSEYSSIVRLPSRADFRQPAL